MQIALKITKNQRSGKGVRLKQAHMMPKSSPKVSIIVGVRDMEATVGQCIESLLKCDYENKEIIVVDDGSKDSTSKVVSAYSVKLIRTPPLGISNARNVGFKESSGQIIAYTDADCLVSEDWLRKLVRHFEVGDVGLVGGRTDFEAGRDIASLCRRVEFKLRYSKVPRFTFSAMGPNCAFRREVLERVGGFNPSWFHGEDAEVSYKVYELGYKIAHELEAQVLHVPEEGLVRYLRKRLRDASAFVRVAFHHLSPALKDRFIGNKLVVQPVLFAFSLFILLLIPLYPVFAFAIAGMLGVCLVWNIDEAALVYRESGKRLDFFKALGVLFLRSAAWGVGLTLGIFKLIWSRLSKPRVSEFAD